MVRTAPLTEHGGNISIFTHADIAVGTSRIFTLRGLTVDFGVQTVLFKDGTANNLANGAQIEVKGTLSSDGTRIIATIIEFEH